MPENLKQMSIEAIEEKISSKNLPNDQLRLYQNELINRNTQQKVFALPANKNKTKTNTLHQITVNDSEYIDKLKAICEVKTLKLNEFYHYLEDLKTEKNPKSINQKPQLFFIKLNKGENLDLDRIKNLGYSISEESAKTAYENVVAQNNMQMVSSKLNDQLNESSNKSSENALEQTPPRQVEIEAELEEQATLVC